MTNNPESIVSDLRSQCDRLIEFARCDEPRTAYDVECDVLRQVLSLARGAMQLFLTMSASRYVSATTLDASGKELRRHNLRSGIYRSVFGNVRFARYYYWSGGAGFCAMDAALNLPGSGPSDLLRQMTEELALSLSYEDATTFLSKYFPVATSTRCVAASVIEDSGPAEAYYDEAQPPAVAPEACILAVQADGKGVPMRRASTVAPDPGRLHQGPTRDGRKQEATVASVSCHRPFVRTPEDVVDSLFADVKPGQRLRRDSDRYDQPTKLIWATLGGKRSALKRALRWVKQLDNAAIKWRIALTDGCEPLQNRVHEAFPKFIRILDLMHAISYLWKASDTWFGKGSENGKSWVRSKILAMLKGQTAAIITEIRGWASKPDRPTNIKVLETSAGYFERNISAMRYDEYLAKGWPIATGIIEGACRYIVKDRCERTGQRWTETGAEAMLHLRCVHGNGHWDDYHAFRRAQRSREIYGREPQSPTETDVYVFNTKTEYAQAA